VAESLGISVDLLYQWRREYRNQGEIAFPGQGNLVLNPDQKRIRELEKKIKDTEMECEILKKAMAIFSKASK